MQTKLRTRQATLHSTQNSHLCVFWAEHSLREAALPTCVCFPRHSTTHQSTADPESIALASCVLQQVASIRDRYNLHISGVPVRRIMQGALYATTVSEARVILAACVALTLEHKESFTLS